MASGERRRRLDSGANLYVSERYDGAQPCSDLNISVASLKSTRRRTGSQCNSCSTDCRGVASTCITLRVLVVHAALDNDRGLLILPVMSKTATVDWSAVVQSRPKECVIALLYQLDYQLRREHCMLPRCQWERNCFDSPSRRCTARGVWCQFIRVWIVCWCSVVIRSTAERRRRDDVRGSSWPRRNYGLVHQCSWRWCKMYAGAVLHGRIHSLRQRGTWSHQ